MSITVELPTKVDLEGPLCSSGADVPVFRHEARNLTRDRAALVLDQNLRFLSRAHGLIDAALGRGIDRLARSGGLLKLGYQRLGDYTTQRLGMSSRRGQELSWMERRLADFPLLDRARRAGVLHFSHVRLLLRTIDPQHEAEWVPRAIGLSVRRLEDALLETFGSRKKPAPPGDDDDEGSPGDDASPGGRWIEARLSPFALLKWDLSLDIVRKMVGADLPEADVVDLMLPEFMLGAGARIAQSDQVRWYKPRRRESPQPGDPGTPEHLERCRNLQRFLEDETHHWQFLPWNVPDVEIAEFAHLPDDLVDPWELDLRLRAICRLAQRVETYLARLLFAVSNHNLWRDMQFTSFGHYVVERLGMSRRNAQGLASLRRRFFELPRTAAAFLEGGITRAQAEAIVRIADEDFEHEWIEYAQKVSYVHLKRLVKALRLIKERSPGEFWKHHRRPPLLPGVQAQTCAPEGDEGPGQEAQTCAPEGDEGPGQDAQTCAPGGDEGPTRDAQTCAPGGDEGPARDAQTCAPADDQVPAQDAQTCAPADDQVPAQDAQTYAPADDHVPAQDAQTCAPGEADPPTWAQIRAAVERRILELMGSSERIPVRFFLPADMEEAWSEFTWLCDAASNGKATTADYLEVLADALLEEHGQAAIQMEKSHPTQSRGHWQCIIPTCSALTNFQEHHVVKRSQGGSNHPTNLSNPCTGHHQAGIHAGHVTVTGTAPDQLTVRQGVSPDGRVHLTFINGVLVTEP